MRRILTAVVLIPLVLVLILWGPFWLQMLAAWVIAELALYEYLTLAEGSGGRCPRWLVLTGCTILFATAYWTPTFLLPAFGILALVLLGICSVSSPLDHVLSDTTTGFFGLIYVAFPLILAPLITTQENGTAQLLFLLIVVWAGDIAALYVGRSVGRHPMAPRLSPKKTWEGAAGSVAGSILCGLALVGFGGNLYRHGISLLLYTQPWWYWAGLAHSAQCCGADRRSTGVGNQARCEPQGFRLHPAGTWRGAGSHRRTPVGTAGVVVRPAFPAGVLANHYFCSHEVIGTYK